MKKPFYKQVWFWVVVVVLGGIIGLFTEDKTPEEPAVAEPQKEQTGQTEPTKKEEAKEPTEEEWQKSYREIALGEAQAYIELTVKGTITPENHESRTGVLLQYSKKITGEDKENFGKLAEAVKSDNLAEAKRLYTELGGEDFEELNKEPGPKKTESKKEPEQNSKPGDIGMDVEGFRKAFNSAAKSSNIDMKLGEIKVEEGAVQDVFTHKISDYVALTGSVNKSDKSMREVTMVGAGDGSIESGTDMLLTVGLLIAATNPDLSPDERGSVLEDVGLLDENVDLKKINKSTERNGIKYTLKGTEELGVWFIVSDANEK